MSDVDTATRTAGPSRASRLARVRMASFGAVTMLIIEFILGMVYNLYDVISLSLLGAYPRLRDVVGGVDRPPGAWHSEPMAGRIGWDSRFVMIGLST
jgi:hypothetical protein